MAKNISLFEYLDFRSYLTERFQNAPRGLQAQLAKHLQCQATHLINITKGKAHFTEDQAFRLSQFFKFSESETSYFLDLLHLDRAQDKETKSYFKKILQAKAEAQVDVKNRVAGRPMTASLEDQMKYFGQPLAPMIHLATSCSHLQTASALAKWLKVDEAIIQQTLDFLLSVELVQLNDNRYEYSGRALHLAKDSPLHGIFQKLRREFVMQNLPHKRQQGEGLYFSSAFATTRDHLQQIKERLLESIETTHEELTKTDSEQVSVLVIDLMPL